MLVLVITCLRGQFGTSCSNLFFKISRVNRSKQTCDYWLITPNQQTLCTETNIFLQRAITKQRAIQNDIINGAMSISINCVINIVIYQMLRFITVYIPSVNQLY